MVLRVGPSSRETHPADGKRSVKQLGTFESHNVKSVTLVRD